MPLTLALNLAVTGSNTAHGGGGSVSLFTIDLQNGAYSIGGVSKALGDCMFEDLSNWGPFNPATDVIPGTGLVSARASQGLTSIGPAFTEAVLAQMRSGCLIAVTHTLATTGDGFSRIRLQLVDSTAFNAAWQGDLGAISGSGVGFVVNEMSDYDSAYTAGDTPSLGNHVATYRMDPAGLSVSYDAGAYSTPSSAPQANPMGTGGIYLNSQAGLVGTATTTIKKIEGFAL